MTKRWLVGAGLSLLLGALYVGRAPLLERAGRFLIAEDAPAAADVIVVLSGSFPDRILEAVALYQEHLAPRIVLCRERDRAAFRRLQALGVKMPRGFEMNRSVAEQLGVPSAAISVLERSAANTYGEAEEVLHYARQHGYRSILLVTSKLHTHRAGVIYRHLAGDAVRIIVRGSRDDDFRPDAWWKDRMDTRHVVVEYQKLLVFFLLDRWRSSSAMILAGAES